MLLADGHVVYFGTPQGSLEHVKKLGLECPAGYNAADHHMDLLVVDSTIDEYDEKEDVTEKTDSFHENNTESNDTGLRQRNKAQRRQTTGGTTAKQKLISNWDSEAAALQIEEEDAEEQAAQGVVGGSLRSQLSRRQSIIMTEKSFNSTWWTQYSVLVHRSMKNSRSAIFTKLNLIKGKSALVLF